MKKYVVLCLLATGCNRTPDAQKPPIREQVGYSTLADGPGMMLADHLEDDALDPTAPDGSMDSAYTVVSDRNRELFTQRVNKRLESGYYLRGPMRTERTGPYSFVYLQGLVRHGAGFGD